MKNILSIFLLAFTAINSTSIQEKIPASLAEKITEASEKEASAVNGLDDPKIKAVRSENDQ